MLGASVAHLGRRSSMAFILPQLFPLNEGFFIAVHSNFVCMDPISGTELDVK
jgi:hypothetical protein